MGHRVEDLERQVAELQAAVDGLTEELVETKERLHQLESSTDAPLSDRDGNGSDAHAEFVPNQGSPTEDEASTDTPAEEPAQETDTADEPNTEDPETQDEAEEADDIIVA